MDDIIFSKLFIIFSKSFEVIVVVMIGFLFSSPDGVSHFSQFARRCASTKREDLSRLDSCTNEHMAGERANEKF